MKLLKPSRAALLFLGLAACAQEVPGERPPADHLNYPIGVVASADRSQLFVASSDFDQRYNAGRVFSLSVPKLFELTADADAKNFRFIEQLGPAITSSVRVDRLGGELAYLDDGGEGWLFTASRTTEHLTRIQASAAGELSCASWGEAVEFTDCTASHVLTTDFPDAFSVAVAPIEGGADQVILTADSTPPLYRDPGLELLVVRQSKLKARQAGGGAIALRHVLTGYYGAISLAAMPAAGAVARFLVAERYNYSEPRLFTLTLSADASAASGLAVSVGAPLDLGSLASVNEIRGITVDAERARAFVSVRYPEAQDSTNSAILVFDLAGDQPALRRAFEVGDGLGQLTLDVAADRRLLYAPDVRASRLYILDASSDQLAVVADIPGLAPRQVDGKNIWAATLASPSQIRFVTQGSRRLGFISNFANSTLAVLDATSNDPRQQALIARFGRAVNTDGKEEGQ